MSGIGQQGERAGEDAEHPFQNDVAEVEGDTDGKGAPEIAGRMGVARTMRVGMPTGVLVALLTNLVSRHRRRSPSWAPHGC